MQNKLKTFLFLAVSLFVAFESFAQKSTFRLGDGVRGPMNTGGSISVFLNNTQPVVGVQFTLVNEPALLSVATIRTGERTNAIFDVVDFNNLSGDTTKILAMNSEASAQLDAGAGEVLLIDFDLQAGAAAGSIPLDITELFLVDANGQLIPTVAQGGMFFDPQVTDFREVSQAAGFEQIFNITCCPSADFSAWADYNNDGYQDVLEVGDFTTLFRNNGDSTFTPVGKESGIHATVTNNPLFDVVNSAAWGDYDNDGDADILMVAGNNVLLVENNGDGTFTDATSASGIDIQKNGNISWVDFNNDGLLDVHIGGGALFQNNGDKSFRNVTQETGMNNITNVSWVDFDNDGDLDAINDESQLRNDGGVFTNITGTTGLVCCTGGYTSWGDYDNDGDLDLYITGGIGNASVFYRNNGDATFTDVTVAAGVGVTNSRVSSWADFDNDADIDLFVTRPSMIDSPYVLFRNNGDGTFTNIASLANVVRGKWLPAFPGAEPGHGLAWTDFNNDGKLDLYVTNGTYPNFLFQNRGNGTGNHFLVLTLVGTNSNKSAIGARVTVEAGGITQIREVEGGANTSQNSLPVEFGLGQAAQVDRITIRWPSGLVESTVRSVAVDQFLTITEGALNVVGVAEDASFGVPKEFRLFQNYPNPFNPTTIIQFQLPRTERVTLKIYNLRGQSVQTLVDEVKQPGVYKIEWDGKNSRGRSVGTGLYVVRMEAGEFVRSKKIVLLK